MKITEQSGTLHLEASVELAKYYEHRVKDFQVARRVILKAISISDMEKDLRGYLEGLDNDDSAMDPEIEKRLKRLENKIRRAGKRHAGKNREEE